MPDRDEKRVLEQFKVRAKADYHEDIVRHQNDVSYNARSLGLSGPQRSFMDDDYGQYKELSLDQTSGLGFNN